MMTKEFEFNIFELGTCVRRLSKLSRYSSNSFSESLLLHHYSSSQFRFVPFKEVQDPPSSRHFTFKYIMFFFFNIHVLLFLSPLMLENSQNQQLLLKHLRTAFPLQVLV